MSNSVSLKSVIKGLGSLRLTVFLLGFSLLLVFFGTLDQVRIGIREAQKLYFESIFVVWRYPEIWTGGNILKWIPIPLPGGYVVGPLLAINLIFGHLRYWRPKWTIIGISFIHIGIIMLLVGQLVTNILAKEDYMWLDEGETANYVESFHYDELYIAKKGEGGNLGVYSVPYGDLDRGDVIDPPPFPFEVKVEEVFGNAEISQGGAVDGRTTYGVNKGIGLQFNLGVRGIGSFHSDSQRDVRTAVVEVQQGGNSIGKWLVSNVFEERFPEQEFTVDGTRYSIGMRFKKTYLPFSLTLLDFRHDRYPGTNIPSNFASQVRLLHTEANIDKELMIFMNNPLRYEGMTFYQASFAKQDQASMFQVVRNPGWLIPYIACTLVSIGLLWQFCVAGIRTVRRLHS
ncbi:MAG: cytochrome c biogenesis protein ResB [Puniceicoccaceae bacterium]